MNNGENVQYQVVKGYDRGEEVEFRIPDLDHRPERWRAEFDGAYYFVGAEGVVPCCETHCSIDNGRYELGNYFRTKGDAKRAIEYIKNCLTKFHSENE